MSLVEAIAWALPMLAAAKAGVAVMRKYSVYEIDALRDAVENRYLWGSFSGGGRGSGFSRSYNEAEKAKVVEEEVRTYMLAGVTAEELYESEGGTSASAYADRLSDAIPIE